MVADTVIGVLGGTGAQGRGLALRWVASGLPVLVGSRDESRAREAASQIALAEGEGSVEGTDNLACATRADIVLLAVPWDAHDATLTELAGALSGKIVIDCVNPLGFDKRGAYSLEVAAGSAAQQAQSLLPGSRVVAAFHHVSAVVLSDLAIKSVEIDVLVLAEDRQDADIVQALAERIPGARGVYAGRLRNAGQVEALTANLITINRRYETHAALRITGEDFAP
jgi:NADPH-dependent F420 reductase